MSLLPRAAKKLLVANRNEIAIRVFRAGHGTGLAHRRHLRRRKTA